MGTGKFIVLEGIDGSGTTTQVGLLAEALRARGQSVMTTCEPSSGPIGSLIRQILTHRFVVPVDKGEVTQPYWQTMALLFAADRMDHLQAKVLPTLQEGTTVISDRYDLSSIAYQGSTTSSLGTVSWVSELNRYAQRPDLTIVLDVPPEIAKKRRENRGGKPETYDDDGIQMWLSRFYLTIEKHVRGLVIHVDGSLETDKVHQLVLETVLSHHDNPTTPSLP